MTSQPPRQDTSASSTTLAEPHAVIRDATADAELVPAAVSPTSAPNDAAPNDPAPDDAAPNDPVPDGAALDDAAPDDAAPDNAAAESDSVDRDDHPGDEPGSPGEDTAKPGEDTAKSADEPSAPMPTKRLGRLLGRRASTRVPDGAGAGRAARLPGRDPLWARAMLVFGVILVVLAGSVITTTRVLAHRYNSSVNRDTLLAAEARVTAPAPERRSTIVGPLNYLLLGSDIRQDDVEAGQRSDTIIIVHIPASLDRAYLISIPRDLRVRIPPFPQADFDGAYEKINGAFQHGGGGATGVQLLSETLTNLIGIRFDGAAIIDFAGFEKAVGLLGGVEMCIDHRVESSHIGVDSRGNFLPPSRGGRPVTYEAGCHQLKPWQALDLVRQRKSLPDGDYGRQRNQQKFLRAVFDRAQEKELTSSPIELDRFVRAVGESMTVDTNGVGLDELMFALRNVQPANLLGVGIPSEPAMIGGIAYIVAFPEADSLYAALRDDTLESWAVENPTWINRV